MTPEKQVIILMATVHQHMAMEERLERYRIPYRTVVKPRQLGTDCGMAIRTSVENIEKIKQISSADGTQIYGIFFQVDGAWLNYVDET